MKLKQIVLVGLLVLLSQNFSWQTSYATCPDVWTYLKGLESSLTNADGRWSSGAMSQNLASALMEHLEFQVASNPEMIVRRTGFQTNRDRYNALMSARLYGVTYPPVEKAFLPFSEWHNTVRFALPGTAFMADAPLRDNTTVDANGKLLNKLLGVPVIFAKTTWNDKLKNATITIVHGKISAIRERAASNGLRLFILDWEITLESPSGTANTISVLDSDLLAFDFSNDL